MSNYATEEEFRHPGVETSNVAAKKGFIALKAKIDRLDINKLVNVPTIFNNLETKVRDLDVEKLKTVPIDLKKIKQCSG